MQNHQDSSQSTADPNRFRRALRSRPIAAAVVPLAAFGAIALGGSGQSASGSAAPSRATQIEGSAVAGSPLQGTPVRFDVPRKPGAGLAALEVETAPRFGAGHGDSVMVLFNFERGEGAAIANPMCAVNECNEVPPLAERFETLVDYERGIVRIQFDGAMPGVVGGDLTMRLAQDGSLRVAGSAAKISDFQAVQVRQGGVSVLAQNEVDRSSVQDVQLVSDDDDWPFDSNDGGIFNAKDKRVDGGIINCGTLTCSMYFTRSRTREIAEQIKLEGASAAGLAAIAGAFGGPVGGLLVGLGATWVADMGSTAEVAADGNGCLVFKYPTGGLGATVGEVGFKTNGGPRCHD